jgi:hypothetical protein
MKRKAISIWLTSLMIAAIFTVVLAGSVSAISNDHNLSGIVWQSDGSAPTGATNFCIWVEHPALSGNWERFPSSGWVQTQVGVDGNWWYSYVLPNAELGSTWGDTDFYKVYVNGTLWGEFDGNTTSNGTGSAGDPFPTPYDPSNPANGQNELHYEVGGGFLNEQQWDVRTVAPIDLAPTNITVQGMIPALWEPVGMPATPNLDLPIYWNVTNFGSVPSGAFSVSIWNCTVTGTNIGVPIDEFPIPSIPPGGDSVVFMRYWYAPLIPGDYYVNITVDSQGVIPEFDEANNRQIIHFIVGPELVITDLWIYGGPPTDPIYVGPGDIVSILAKAQNAGSTPTGTNSFNLTIYNTTGFGGPIILGSEISILINALGASEKSLEQEFFWQAPLVLGDYYINISVDFSNDVLETDETNNEISIHFNVPPIPVTKIWSGNPVHVESIYWYVTSTTELNFTVSSFNPPPYYTWYMITDDTTATVVKTWANYTFEGTNYTLGTWGEDTYRITYYSIDSVNAVEGWKNKTIIVDDSDPLTSIGFGGPRYRAIVLNASGIGDEIGSGIFYRILRQSNNDVMRDWTQSTFFTVVDGLYTANPFMFSSGWTDDLYRIEFYSIDNLGHTESVKSIIVNLDNTAPDKVIDYGAPNYRANPPGDIWNISSASDITLTADDGSGSGVNRTEYRVWNPFFDTGWVTYSAPFSISNSWTDGIYTIDYNSTDNLGNDQADSDTFYLDNTGPVTTIIGDHSTIKFTTPELRYEITILTIFNITADDGEGCGVQYTEYMLESQGIWRTYATGLSYNDIFANLTENQRTGNQTIVARSEDYLGTMGNPISFYIYLEEDVSPPNPPVLEIYKVGNDIRLEWYYPLEIPTDIAYYKIYEGSTIDDSIFGNLEADTSGDAEPLRSSWTFGGAGEDGENHYYVITAVDTKDNEGYTSNIVGKVTLTFSEGYNTFALPLDPFDISIASEIIEDPRFTDDRDTIYRYDTKIQQWMGHAKNMPSSLDDFELEFGQGYMIYVVEEEIEYSFTGASASSIRFMKGVVGSGDLDNVFRDSLEITHENGNLQLSWSPVTGASGYNIYMGTTRYGLDSLNDFSIEMENINGPVTQTTWATTMGSENELYFLVVALEANGEEGSSTFAVGVKEVTYSEGYSVISMDLQPKSHEGVGFFANVMFKENPGTLFYYDKENGNWRGHPRVLPENINNVEVNTGFAYIVYVDAEDVSYVYTGV